MKIYDKNFLFLESSSKTLLDDSESSSDLELLKSPFQENTKPAPKPYSNLKDLLNSHKKSLNLDDNVKRMRFNREDLWHESLVIFKNPSFDFEASPIVKFEGEAGIDAGGVRREFGSLLCKEIFSTKTNLFEGKNDRKLPIYSVDNMCSRIFQIAGKIVSYFIIHLGIGIPCLCPATYHCNVNDYTRQLFH